MSFNERGKWVSGALIKVKPLFVLSWEFMGIDMGLGKHQHATAEMVNKWCMLPMFIHILMAHKMNKYLVDTVRETEVYRTVLFAMRHYVHNHSDVNFPGHPCITEV